MTNYNQLLADLQSWLADENVDFVADIPKIIILGEERLIKDLDFTIFDSTISINTVISAQSIAKTTLIGYISARELTITTAGKTSVLDLKTQGWIEMMGVTQGIPRYYSEDSVTTINLAPIPNAVYAVKVRYRKYPVGLAAGVQNTWLSDNFGDGLFKACLAESEKYIKNDQRSSLWEADYLKEVPGLKRFAETLGGYQYSELRPSASVKQENERTD